MQRDREFPKKIGVLVSSLPVYMWRHLLPSKGARNMPTGQSCDVSVPDEQLLGRFVSQGDAAAFEALVRRHGPMVLGVCRRLLQHP